MVMGSEICVGEKVTLKEDRSIPYKIRNRIGNKDCTVIEEKSEHHVAILYTGTIIIPKRFLESVKEE